MAGRTIGVVLVGVTIMVAGCATAPTPPWQVNAVLPRNAPIYKSDPNACAEADTLVVAQCTGVDEYSRSGSQRWAVADWQVIRTERGWWPERDISFVFRRSDAESRYEHSVTSVPEVYYPGAVMGFCIDTNKATPVIVAEEARSRTLSHGTLMRPNYDAADQSRPAVFRAVLDAARKYLNQTLRMNGTLSLTEEYDQFFVVEARTARKSIALKVDKNTYQVTVIPDTLAPGNSYDSLW